MRRALPAPAHSVHMRDSHKILLCSSDTKSTDLRYEARVGAGKGVFPRDFESSGRHLAMRKTRDGGGPIAFVAKCQLQWSQATSLSCRYEDSEWCISRDTSLK